MPRAGTPMPKAGHEVKRQRALELRRRDPELERWQIAERLGVTLTTIEDWLNDRAARHPIR